MLNVLRKTYPMIWPFAFLAGGLVAVFWGSHLHFDLFGQGVMVNLHNWMWFLMALAHADALWRRRRNGPGPAREHAGLGGAQAKAG